MRPSGKAKELVERAADLMAKAAEAHIPSMTELGSRAYWGIILEDTLDRLDEEVKKAA